MSLVTQKFESFETMASAQVTFQFRVMVVVLVQVKIERFCRNSRESSSINPYHPVYFRKLYENKN